ncbi:MAG: zinc ABC transporter substrate-binding protein [Eubacterium sp.]|nr:zinc ABC transporter substrate-binding protein [Eubacterium sp.]
MKKRFKKWIAVLMTALLVASVFAACAKTEGEQPAGSDGKLSVVTTIFPEYDWVIQVLGDRAEAADVRMLLDNGADLHNYQPTADDMIAISTCDLFIYVGGESDEWVEDALANATNQNMLTVNLLEALGSQVKEEETVEGMQPEEEEADEDEPEYDEHVWLSLKNAQQLVSVIAEKLGDADPDYRQTYLDNAAAYSEQLAALDGQYQAAVDAANVKTLVFGDRFPFRYMTDDYGLRYYAAFAGCSAETEASFETVSFLSQKVDEYGLNYVMTIEGTDHKLAQTVVENTTAKTQQLLSLNSMQSVTAKDVEAGNTYLDIMQSNLTVLTQALNN